MSEPRKIELFISDNTVTKCCETDQFHMNMFWHNGQKKLFQGEDEYGNNEIWCHNCESETHLIDKELTLEERNQEMTKQYRKAPRRPSLLNIGKKR